MGRNVLEPGLNHGATTVSVGCVLGVAGKTPEARWRAAGALEMKNRACRGLSFAQETDRQCLTYMKQVGQRRAVSGSAMLNPLATNDFAI